MSSAPSGATGNPMFSAGPAHVSAATEKPATEQLNLRIRADLYLKLERASVVLGARRGTPTHRVAIVEEALEAFFAQNGVQ
jgi:hypothetical protein